MPADARLNQESAPGDEVATDAAVGHSSHQTPIETNIVSARAVELPKRKVRFFVSYAHEDEDRGKLKSKLLEHLMPLLANSNQFKFQLWHDDLLLLMDGWHEQIQAAIKECEFGLLMVSPNFLRSSYIAKNELAHYVRDENDPTPLVSSSRRAIAVGLKRLDFARMDLKGLRQQQIFFKQRNISFSECTGRTGRDQFAYALFAKIQDSIVEFYKANDSRQVAELTDFSEPGGEGPTCNSDVAPALGEGSKSGDSFAALRRHIDEKLEGIHPVPVKAARRDMKQGSEQKVEPQEEGEEALTLLENWLRDREGARFCALLGETGMGKTTTSQCFTQTLLRKRSTEPELPVPRRRVRYRNLHGSSNPLCEILGVVERPSEI